MLLKGLDRQIPIDVLEFAVQRPDILHPANRTQKTDHTRELRPISRIKRDEIVRSLQLDVLGGANVIRAAEKARPLGVQGRREVLHSL